MRAIDFDPELARKRQLGAAIEQVIRRSFADAWPNSDASPRFFYIISNAVLEFFEHHNAALNKHIAFMDKQRMRELEIAINPPLFVIDKSEIGERLSTLEEAHEFKKQMRHVFGPFYIRRKA